MMGHHNPRAPIRREPVVAPDAHSLLGEPSEALCRVVGLAQGVCGRLAVLARDEGGELFAFRAQRLESAT
jgi:hypothetical protein